MSKINIVVLGKTGMLGSMVYTYLKKNSRFKVSGTQRIKNNNKDGQYFDVPYFMNNPKDFEFIKKADYIINCIGIIKPYCKDDDPVGVFNAIQVNSLFPHVLSKFLGKAKTKVIQIATDCVYSGSVGLYTESSLHDPLDVYGKSKSLGEVDANNFLNIRCSIIGPEIKGKLSLLEWFLSQPDKSNLTGFENHLWNGVTTLQFAQLCEMIIIKNIFEVLRRESKIHHYVPNTIVSKYELLEIFKKNFQKNVNIIKGNGPVAVDRTIKTQLEVLKHDYSVIKMTDAIKELAHFMNANKLF